MKTPGLQDSNTPNSPYETWEKLRTLTILLTSKVGKNHFKKSNRPNF